MRAKLEVISIPYTEGQHICHSVQQASSLATFMKELHDANLVLDLVLKENGSQVIDFDFGGPADSVRISDLWV